VLVARVGLATVVNDVDLIAHNDRGLAIVIIRNDRRERITVSIVSSGVAIGIG